MIRKSLRQKRKSALKEFNQQQCLSCRNVFEGQSLCPKCGSRHWTGHTEVNPYTHLPLENLMKLCGHGIWFFSTFFMLFLLWQTDSDSESTNTFYLSSAFFVLFFGVLFSVLYFAVAEIIGRVLKIQRRVKTVNQLQKKNHEEITSKKHRNKRKAMQSSIIRRESKASKVSVE